MPDSVNVNTNGKDTRVIMTKFTDETEGWRSSSSESDSSSIRRRHCRGGTEKQVICSDSSVLDLINVHTNGKNTMIITKLTNEVEGWGSFPSTEDVGCSRRRIRCPNGSGKERQVNNTF